MDNIENESYLIKIYFTPNMILEHGYTKFIDYGNKEYSYYAGNDLYGDKILMSDLPAMAIMSSNKALMYKICRVISEKHCIPIDNIQIVNARDDKEVKKQSVDLPF